MRIIVCAKQVADWEAAPELFGVGPDGRVAIDQRVKRLPSLFDEHAIEAGLQLKEALGGTVAVLSLGPPAVVEVGKRALRMGVDEAAVISDPALPESDAYTTAWALSLGVARLGGADLVLCGRQAADTDASQVGAQLAAELGVPFCGAVRAIEASDGALTVERLTGNSKQTLRVRLPAVVSVTNEINKPRLTSVTGILAAAKKQIPVWTLSELGAAEPPPPRVRAVGFSVPDGGGVCQLVRGENAEESGEMLAAALRAARVI